MASQCDVALKGVWYSAVKENKYFSPLCPESVVKIDLRDSTSLPGCELNLNRVFLPVIRRGDIEIGNDRCDEKKRGHLGRSVYRDILWDLSLEKLF